ncbi:MAG: tRNA lysidine(34) synthetase TilS [Lachnospiraceae bacterium]|nr:tRNA lysidine(34) synthetase TilS [Lachnospiraceae bacterium]
MNKDEIRNRAYEFAKKHNMLNRADKVVAGISGGADSMCLLGLLLEWRELLELEIFVIHVNHGIRGAAADEDERFVEDFCRTNNVHFKAVHADVPKMARLSGCTEEEEGRNLRYRTFAEAAKEFGCNRIAVAHNRSDNAETVIFNILRGSGIAGLAGIPPVRTIIPGNETDKTAIGDDAIVNNATGEYAAGAANKAYKADIIRPLLYTSREEIEYYLAEKGMTFRTDATNFETEYSRNVLRNIIIPIFRDKINSASEEHIVRLAGQACETEEYLFRITASKMAEMEASKELEYVGDDGLCAGSGRQCDENDDERDASITACRIKTDPLENMEPLIRYRVVRSIVGRLAGRLKDITNVHIEDICGLLDKQVGRRIDLPYGLIARRDYGLLVIERADVGSIDELSTGGEWLIGKEELTRCSSDSKQVKVINSVKPLEIGIYCTETIPFTDFTKNLYTKLFDCDKIKNGVSIRYRKSGDYLMLRGREGELVRKSLKSWMIDNKIPSVIRNRIPLVTEGSHVLWVIGYRRDDSYQVDENTKNILVTEVREL